MTGLETECHHGATLRNWSKSAEFNRIKLRHQVDFNPQGNYRVRMAGSPNWVDCDMPPITGAAEWIYLNQRAIPIFYWSLERNAVVLI